MKIFVTGSEGYLGMPLVNVLREAGHDVIGLDTVFYDKALYNGFAVQSRLLRGDVRRVTQGDLFGFDAVVHLAELSNDPLGQINPEITKEVNHEGTVHLARTAKAAGVSRFVYFSSCSVYGASDTIANETSPVHPFTAYAECKVMNEQSLLALADGTFTPVILRNATAFGPSPRMRFDIVINNLAGRAWTSGEIKMDSDGTPWRPFVHVDDITRATICALVAPKDSVKSEIFNVGGLNSNYQIRDIAAIIGEVFSNCVISLNPKGADKRNYRVDFAKINSQLPGFRAQKDVKIGVLELRALFEKIHLTKEQFLSKDYTRLKQIQYLRETGKVDDHLFWTA